MARRTCGRGSVRTRRSVLVSRQRHRPLHECWSRTERCHWCQTQRRRKSRRIRQRRRRWRLSCTCRTLVATSTVDAGCRFQADACVSFQMTCNIFVHACGRLVKRIAIASARCNLHTQSGVGNRRSVAGNGWQGGGSSGSHGGLGQAGSRRISGLCVAQWTDNAVEHRIADYRFHSQAFAFRTWRTTAFRPLQA